MNNLNLYGNFLCIMLGSTITITAMLYAPAEFDMYFANIGLLMCAVSVLMCAVSMFCELKRIKRKHDG
ncbi:MAG: hypothetical protein ACT6FG_08470 [Methanosarcinaceae archaeon]